MTAQSIEALMQCQTALIAALDAGDVAEIERATQEMGSAVEALRADDGRVGSNSLPSLDHAMRQNQAARIRVNYLSEFNRQKIDRLSEIRGADPALTYRKYR